MMKVRNLPALLLATLLGACAAFAPTPPTPTQAQTRAQDPAPVPTALPTLVGTEWTAFAIEGVDEVALPKPTLSWTSVERVAGSGGCNDFSGAASAHLPALRIGPLVPGARRCLSLPGGQEDKYFKALEQARSLHTEGDQLLLLNQAGGVLVRFIRRN
jgi:heat shock protein HslJ